jgi:peptide/nickel transport system ATP-binding protein
MSAVPIPDPPLKGRGGRILLPDELPDPANPPQGCAFARRCRYAEEGRCDTCEIPLPPAGEFAGHGARCVRREELDLQGILGAESTGS